MIKFNFKENTIERRLNLLMNDDNDLIYRDQQNKQNNHALKNRDYSTIKNKRRL